MEYISPTTPRKPKVEKELILHDQKNQAESLSELNGDDIYSLRPEGWLTDNVLYAYSQTCLQSAAINNDNVYYGKESIAITPPSICLLLKMCESDTEVAVKLAEMDIIHKELSIWFINDATASHSGSHWSVMLFIKKDNIFHHIDSIPNTNIKHAKTLGTKIRIGLNL